jgi:hypothetical protein
MLSKLVPTAWARVNCVGIVAAVMAATMIVWAQSGARANDKKELDQQEFHDRAQKLG